MFRITFYGHTINIPNDVDFYTVVTEKRKLFTTDFDISITPEVLRAFEIGGLLTLQNDAFFQPKTLPATLSGSGVLLDCTLTINSIKQKEGKLNVALEAPSLLPTIFYEQQHSHSAYDSLVYPLIREGRPQPFDNGFETSDGRYLLNMPNLTLDDVMNYLSQLDYTVDFSAIENPRSISIYPLSVYCDARYKMRRVYFDCLMQHTNTGNRVPFLRLFKGDYYNLINDTCELNYEFEHLKNRLYFQNKFTLSEDCKRMRIAYLINRDSDAIYDISSEYYIKIEKKNKETGIYTTFFDNVEHQTSPLFMSFDISDDDLIIDDTTSYVDFDNLRAGDYRITFMMQDELWDWGGRTQAFTGCLQYMFDDDCQGVRPIEGNLDDESIETHMSPIRFSIKTGSFHSGCWGMKEYEYGMKGWLHRQDGQWYTRKTQVITNYRREHGFNEVFFNQSPALMYTNRLSAFQNESIFDILQKIATFWGMRVHVDHLTRSVSFSDKLSPALLPDYTLYDELRFDNSYAVDGVRYKNMNENYIVQGTNVAESEQVIMDYRISPAVDDDDQTKTYVWYNAALASSDDADPEPEIYNGRVIFPAYYANTAYSYTFSQTKHNYLITNNSVRGDVAVLQNVEGYCIYDESLSVEEWQRNQMKYDYPTTLSVGQIVKTKYIGVMLNDFVVYQTRIFRVLSQEIDSTGVNDLELLLYE